MCALLQSSCPFARKRLPKAVLLFVLALGLSSCNLLKTTLALPEKGIRSILLLDQGNRVPDPVELQSQLLRFADNAIETLNIAIGKLQTGENEAARRRNVLLRRLTTTNDILAVATGANAYVNLLDMAILASLNRMNVEDYWIPKIYGESARPYLLAARQVEEEIWRIAATTLTAERLSELRAAIKTWHEEHPNVRSPSDVGALGFAAEVSRIKPRSATPITASVFNLLSIDPLAGLNPAAREVANTRLFGERSIFLARHMPTLVRWETELLARNAAEIPQMEKLLANAAQLSEAADRISRTAEVLPEMFSTEREQIVKALNEQRPGLLSLAEQSEKTLNAGKQMSDASTATLKSFQDVLRQLDSSPPDPNEEPFRINEYTAAAAQINAAAQDLVKLLQTFDHTLASDNLDKLSTRLETTTQKIQLSGKALVDYAFRQILMLVAATCAMVLVSVVAFWSLKKKFA